MRTIGAPGTLHRMCGIGGILRVTPPGETFVPIPVEWADALDASIKHRGPDGSGRFRDKATREDGSIVEVVLVHRRLSIIDHEGGAQPMVSESGLGGMGRVAVVFNGCLYNHRELRKELEERGHVFESDHSDTEVWVHLYREAVRNHPPERAPDFGVEVDIEWELWDRTIGIEPEGMYAVAVWDHGRGSLSLFQDQLKEKPLYSSTFGNTTVFCSCAKGVEQIAKRVHGTPLALERCVLADWISLGFHNTLAPHHDISASRCCQVFPHTNVRQTTEDLIKDTGLVSIGCFIVLMILGGIGMLLWWISKNLLNMKSTGPLSAIHNALLAGSLVVLLLMIILAVWLRIERSRELRNLQPTSNPKQTQRAIEAVRKYGDLLNTSVCSRLDADVPVGCFLSGGIDSSLIAKFAHDADPSIKTFCMRMPDERYDESPYAQQIADIIGCEHHTMDVSPEPARDFVHLITELGLPFGDSSILPNYWLCKAARKYVKVALSGDGGDELFVGYERQIAARWLRWARWLGPLAPLVLTRLDRSDPKGTGDKAARFLEAARGCGYTDLVAIFPKRERVALLGDKAGRLCRMRVFGGIERAVRFDREVYLPGDLLRKIDTASMSVGLEVRCPFLSRELWDAVTPMPAGRLVPHGKRKAVLREIAYQHFPKELVDRPKQGFSIPIGEWFRTDFGGMRSLLHEKLDRPRPFGLAHDVLDFNMDYVRRITEEHMEQRRDHSQRLFMLTSLAIWSDSLDN